MKRVISFYQDIKQKINKKGQGMIEYGLIISMVAIGLIAALGLLTGQLGSFFETIVDNVPGAQ